MPKPDYMSEQQYNDMEAMKDKVIQRKVDSMDYAISALRYTEQDLKSSGHKSVEGMIRYIVENCNRDCLKLINDHVRKYPDR